MQEAVAVRRAALGAIEDVDPERLCERLDEQLSSGSVVPGVLTLRSVQALADPDLDPDAPSLDPVVQRGAGVQLIYDGLALTRKLAHEEPWETGDRDEGDLDILAADVLVARGFHLLARTEAATTAVDVVRAFGRDQTIGRETDDPTLDCNLEADVLELAVVAGTTAAGGGMAPQLREFAVGLVDGPGFPPADQFFSDRVGESLRTLVADVPSSEGVLTSVND